MYPISGAGYHYLFDFDFSFNDYFNDCPCHSCNGFGGGEGETGGSPPKDEGVLKKWLDRLADALKKLAGKAVETLPAIVQSAVGAILSFLGKAVGFVAEHTWILIVFAVGLVGWWLMQKVKKS